MENYNPIDLPLIINNNQANKATNDENLLFLIEPSRKQKYGKGSEAKLIKEAIGDFDVNNSTAYKKVIQQFGKSVRLSEILGVLNSIHMYLKMKKNIILPPISRNEKRSFPLLMKYIEINGEMIIPYFQYITLCDSSFQKIDVDNM